MELFEREGVPDSEKPWEGRNSKSAVVLNALRSGPLTTSDLLEIDSHRFACEIHSLRQQGYIIKTERHGKNQCLYTLAGKSDVKKVDAGMQEAYYGSQHWIACRKLRLKFDQHECVRCHSKQHLQVHHWQYELFEESIHDLQTLCCECHEWVHSLPTVKIGFPRTVPIVTHNRLQQLMEA